MARTHPRARASPYPPLAFHLIRSCLLVCALIVSGILSFFVYHLEHDNFKLPWTFLVLFGVALLSLLVLTLTLFFHLCHKLSPLISLLINVLLLLMWTTGLGLLGWNVVGTLSHSCSSANWGSSAGMMICRTYKALFAFALLGALSTLALVVLDIGARKRQKRTGQYDQMKDGSIDEKPSENAFSSGALGRDHDTQLEPWQSAGQAPIDYDLPGASRERIRSQHFGYVSPSEQIHYDAGSYAGRDRY